jgi:hypothetical protein
MTGKNLPPRDAFTSALIAIANLLESDFAKLHDVSWTEALAANSEMEQLHFRRKTVPFFRHFVPLRQQMSALLTDAYRRLFKLALANPSQTGNNPDGWAWTQLQPAVDAVLQWIPEWYILACDGQNQSVRHAGSLDFVPAQTASLSIPATVPQVPLSTSWRAPAWLFGISIVLFGIGGLKPQHVPNMDSDERLGETKSSTSSKVCVRPALRV